MSAAIEMSTDEPEALAQALSLLAEGFWPVPIKPGSKAPIGNEWGRNRPTEASLRETFLANPGAGIGIKLGKPGGVIDFDIDDPETGDDSLCSILGGLFVSRGWANSDRRTHLLARWDDRLAAFNRTIVKSPKLPGLEIRIGALRDDDDRQLQTVVPPTPTTKGEPRRWNGVDEIAALPGEFFDRLAEVLRQDIEDSEPRVIPLNIPGATDRYVRKAIIDECEEVAATPEGDRNNRLNIAAFKLGTLVGAGALDRSTAEHALVAAASQAGLGGKESSKTIRSGIDAGTKKPRDLSGIGAKPSPRPGSESPHDHHKSHKNPRTTDGPTQAVPNIVGSVVNVGGFHLTEEEWTEPRMGGPDPAEPFPLDVLPDRLRRFCEEAAASIQCPVDFIACQVVVLAGGVIGQSVNLEVKPHYYEAPNLYLALVGAPGEKKSPPIKLASRALWRIDGDLRDEYRDAKQEYEVRLQEWNQNKRNPDRGLPPSPPIHRQLTLDDATREAVALIHSQNLRGLVLIKPELVGWVKALNTFKGGKGDDRQFWLSVNSNETVKVSRKGTAAAGPGEPIIVPSPCVTIVGGLQPDILPEFRESKHDDGWIDRILFTYPDPIEADEWSDEVIADEALADWEELVARLFRREMVVDIDTHRVRPYNVRFTPQARECWKASIKTHRAEKKDPEFAPSLRGPWAKLEAYAARLALILSQVNQACTGDMGQTPADVDAFDVYNAWRLIAYFKAHFRRARALLIRKPNTGYEEGTAILRWIARSLRDTSTAMGRKLAEQGDRKFISRRDVDVQFNWWDDEDQAAGLSWLVRRRVLRPGQRDDSAHHRGRPPSQVYEINPLWVRPTITTNPTEIGQEADPGAVEFVRGYLRDSDRPASSVIEDGARSGFSEGQIRRAAEEIGVRPFVRDGAERWEFESGDSYF